MINNRIESLRTVLEDTQAVLITSDVNRLYLTGFTSSAGVVLIGKEFAYLLIDFRYFEKAAKTVSDLNVILSNRLYEQIGELLKSHNIKEICVEASAVTLAQFHRFKKELPDFNISGNTGISEYIEKLRSVKSAKETEYIAEAQRLTDLTFSYITKRIKAGLTEREVMLDMEFFMRKNGSEGVAFDTIVISGKNSSLPHGVPTNKVIENGDFITMDFGAAIAGYRSDMTRTVAVGKVTKKQEMIYNTVLKAQKAALDFIKPQIECKSVDKIARDIISEAGFADCFGHGLGHSVGLEIHENPSFNTRDTTLLKEGMILTVEPGIYIEDEFGVRIEDMVQITETGYRNFTKSPKELMIL